MSYQSRLKALTEWLCRDFTVFAWDSTTLYVPTGEEFIELVAGDGFFNGIVRNRYNTFAEAINAYEKTLEDYLDTGVYDFGQRRGVIYWRIRPEISNSAGWWTVYSRLLVSDKPIDEEFLRRTTCFFDHLPEDADMARGYA